MGCEIILKNSTGPYKPGDTIEGIVEYIFIAHDNTKGILLKLRGIESTKYQDWADSSITEDPVKYSGQNKFLKINQTLQKPNPKTSEYPFKFVLPKDSPSSFDTTCGSVKYYLIAQLESEPVADKISEVNQAIKNISVVASIDLNDLPGLKMSRSQYSDEKQVPNLWCGKVGTSTLDVFLDKEGFILEETISFTVTVKNTSDRRISKIWTKLEQVILQRFTSPCSKVKCESFLMDSEMVSGMKSRAEQTCTFALNIPKSTKIHNLRSCKLLKQRFILQVAAEFDKYKENLKVQIPLIIGHIPFIRNISENTLITHMTIPGETPYPPPREEVGTTVTMHMMVPGQTPYPPVSHEMSTSEVHRPSAPISTETYTQIVPPPSHTY